MLCVLALPRRGVEFCCQRKFIQKYGQRPTTAIDAGRAGAHIEGVLVLVMGTRRRLDRTLWRVGRRRFETDLTRFEKDLFVRSGLFSGGMLPRWFRWRDDPLGRSIPMIERCAGLEAPAVAGAIDLQQQFAASPYQSLRHVKCAVAGGRVVLRGTVPCYYLKQIAQTLAMKKIGLGRVVSDIEVQAD